MEYVFSIISLPHTAAGKVVSPLAVVFRHLHDHFFPHPRNNYHPHILGHRVLALFSVLLVTVKIFTIALITFGPFLPAASSAITIQNVITLANQSRQSFGLGSLTESSLLNKAAQAKAEDMAAKGYFSHTSPDGKTPWNFIETSGYNYILAGENLAVHFTDAESMEQAWMNSPSHKANILNRNFEEIGIGIAQGQYQGKQTTFVVQMFGTPVEQKIVISQTPTPVQKSSIPDIPASTAVAVKPVAAEGRQNEKAPPAVETQFSITQAELKPQGRDMVVAVESPLAVKVVASYGQKAVMLSPKPQGRWEGVIPLSALSGEILGVRIKAIDISGQVKDQPLAYFSGGLKENFNILGAQTNARVQFLGKVFDPKSFEQKFYLFFIAGILSSLILAIAIKRHIQHLSLIANSSFVIVLAVLMWWTG